MEEQKKQQYSGSSVEASHFDACPGDEINLFDLWRVLVRQWKVICAITGLSLLGAVAYVLLATPVYEAQTVVKLPDSKDVEVLNIPDICQVSRADMFDKFSSNLKSSSLYWELFDSNPQLFPLRKQDVVEGEKVYFSRENLPKIKDGEKKESSFFYVTLQGTDPKLVADRLNAYILLVEKETLKSFVSGVKENISIRKKMIENQLQIGRDYAVKRRQDRIALLENQIAIARAAKIFERKLSSYSAIDRQSIGVTFNTDQDPLYMRGVKELSAEKKELEARKNDEPFIDGFRDKQEKLAQLDAGLKQLQAAVGTARAVMVDQLAIQPKSPVKPKRKFVLVLSVLLGGMLGIFSAFLVNAVEQQKKMNKEKGGDSMAVSAGL